MVRAVLSAPRSLRMVAVILAIAAMLCVSAASVSAAHTHSKEPVGRCDVCSTAHQAAQQIVVAPVVHAPHVQSQLAKPIEIHRIESRTVLTLLTRGPPSSLPTAA